MTVDKAKGSATIINRNAAVSASFGQSRDVPCIMAENFSEYPFVFHVGTKSNVFGRDFSGVISTY